MSQRAAQAFFVAGTIPFLFAGGPHALLALVDTAGARYFTPRDRSVKGLSKKWSRWMARDTCREARTQGASICGHIDATEDAASWYVAPARRPDPVLGRALESAMEGTRIRYGGSAAPSVWRAWLGFNISHGLGIFTFGLLCLLIATHDFKVVEEIDAILPLTIAFSAAYFVLSLRFWFYGPAILTGIAATCFTAATALSA